MRLTTGRVGTGTATSKTTAPYDSRTRTHTTTYLRKNVYTHTRTHKYTYSRKNTFNVAHGRVRAHADALTHTRSHARTPTRTHVACKRAHTQNAYSRPWGNTRDHVLRKVETRRKSRNTLAQTSPCRPRSRPARRRMAVSAGRNSFRARRTRNGTHRRTVRSGYRPDEQRTVPRLRARLTLRRTTVVAGTRASSREFNDGARSPTGNVPENSHYPTVGPEYYNFIF